MYSLRWDIYCKVIDNHGDIGVCWRLCADLAARGHQVRLYVDDACALDWMAPQGCARVQVLAWSHETLMPLRLAARADVVIEAFGCELGGERVAHYADPRYRAPVWLNLEYLSAEAYVERCHRLASPVLHGPGKGLTKHFFYPGFTAATGGLLREGDLEQRQSAFDRQAWLAQQGIGFSGERLISLFCYEPPALSALLEHLVAAPQPTRLLVTAGRAQAAVRALLQHGDLGQLAVTWLPALSQRDYDQLLWACDLNFVRGEDSLVRALWAAKPFVWNIYAQADGAHASKLEAFLGMLQAPTAMREFHRVWNGLSSAPLPALDQACWGETALAARSRLQSQLDLSTQLLHFVEKTAKI